MGPIFNYKNRTDLSKDFITKLEEKDNMNMTKYVDILGREIYEHCMYNDLKFINEHDELIKEYEKN